MSCPGRSLEQMGMGRQGLPARRPSFLVGPRVACEVVELFTVLVFKGGVGVAVVEASIEYTRM